MKRKRLEAAIRAGDLDKVRELIAAGADVSSAWPDGMTPIQLAAQERQTTILRALVAAGADLGDLENLGVEDRLTLFVEAYLDTETDDDLMTPGDFAAWAEQALAEQMDDKLAAEIRAHEGNLFRAVRTGDLELLTASIAAGEDVDQVRQITRDTPLTLAVQEGDEDMIRELISAGANINHSGFSTPLSFALPDLRTAKLLLDAGADPYVRGLDRRTPLERAVDRAIHPSCSADSPLLVRFFLEAGVDPANAEIGEGTLLMEAEHATAWEVYQELLPHYSEQTARESFRELEIHRDLQEAEGGSWQWTFDLKYAARRGEAEELRQVLARGGDDISREAGLAVREAIANLEGAQQLEAIRMLIDAGADLDAAERFERRRGSTVLACAAESWHRRSKDAMRLLIEAGATVDQRGHLGRTPLMYAVLAAYRHGAVQRKALPLLLEAGADPNLEDELGYTAWSLARAPLLEAEERPRFGSTLPNEAFFDGPDLSEFFSDAANKADRRRDRLDRCREVLEVLEAAGAHAHGEAELRLMMAITAGELARVDELLAAGASPLAHDTAGQPALVAAAETGSSEIVSRLIDAGCDADVKMPGGSSALEIAVRDANKSMTRDLIDAGANVLMMASMGSATLRATDAAGAENPEAREVVEMIRAALPPEVAHIDRDIADEIAADDLYYESQAELPRQAAFGDLDKVRELLAVDGVEIDGFDVLNRTALTAAAEAGQHEIVRYLIAAGADVNKCNDVVGSQRSTPLVCAAISSSAERDQILKQLLDAGADPDRLGADGRTALMHAVERDVGFFGRTGEFALSSRTLIAAGGDLEIQDPYGLTAWMRCLSLASSIEIDEVAEQYEALARLLEEADASTDRLADVELIWAVEVGDIGPVQELLASGADANARRYDGATALMLAIRDLRRDVAELLIESGCDVSARQWVDRGPSAVDAAAEARDRGLVRMLVAAGASEPEAR